MDALDAISEQVFLSGNCRNTLTRSIKAWNWSHRWETPYSQRTMRR
jgi:hypothetical protein